MGKMVYLKNVTTLKINTDKCSGCGVCLEVCPHSVLTIKARQALIVDRDACMECGACARNCARGAITVAAGVGCAAAIIGSMLGKKGEVCCGPSSGKSTRSCC